MKYQGRVEFLPKKCTGECLFQRQTVLLIGDDTEREVEAILPCASPDCSGSVEGEGLNLLFESEDGKRWAAGFERYATKDGWKWRRSSRVVECP